MIADYDVDHWAMSSVRPVATTTPRGLPAWGRGFALGSDLSVSYLNL
jgi:hypothetical protein